MTDTEQETVILLQTVLGASAGPSGGASGLLLEGGSYLLLEDGSYLLLE